MKDFFNSHKGLQLKQPVFAVMGILCKAVAACMDRGKCNLRRNGSRRIAWQIFMFQSDVLDPFL